MTTTACLRCLLLLASLVPLPGAVKDPEQRAQLVFDQMDTNHDGQVSFAEFAAWRIEHLHHRRPGDGAAPGTGEDTSHLTMQALSPVGGGHPAPGTPPGPTTSGTTPPTTTTPPPLPPELRRRLHRQFERIDTNHDGKISLAEWLAFAQAHQHHKPGAVPTPPGPVLPTTPPSPGSSGTAGASTPPGAPAP